MAIGDGVSAIASLAVTFGGFSPTAMDGVAATKAQIERLEEERSRKRELDERKRALERSRLSSVRHIVDGKTTWSYVVVDERMVRIESCETSDRQLVIPGEIDDKPVFALAADACAYLETVEVVCCPPSLEIIGACAFRGCSSLRKISFPESVATFSGSWLRECDLLEEVDLPGFCGMLRAEVFGNKSLKRMRLGAGARELEPGAMRDVSLEEIEVSPDNPFMKSDGIALYSIDGSVLIAYCGDGREYVVRDGCRSIAKKAFDGRFSLETLSVPEGVESLGEFAFTHSGLRVFQCPSTLRVIGEKAFYYCRQLTSIQLNEGLTHIGDSAFEESGLEGLHIPASIEHIGKSITRYTPVKHRGPDCSISIDEASDSLFLDGNGGLYRREGDAVLFVQLIDRDATDYEVLGGTAVIGAHAFSYNDAIRVVSVPDGVVTVEDNAFRHCTNLTRVSLPDSVERIGDFAFLDTALESFRIPSRLAHLGRDALITSGAHHGDEQPSLARIEVADGNERFYVCQGMLCRRDEDGDRVVLFDNSESVVEFPETIVGVEQYAFNNARGIKRLALDAALKTISANGLTTWCWIEEIDVKVDQPVEGKSSFTFHFPDIMRSKHGISVGIGGASWVNVPGIFEQYDICVANAHDYNSPRNEDSISAYDQARLILDRLDDPVLLKPRNKMLFERIIEQHIIEICVDIARHDDRTMIDRLVDAGFLDAGNLEEAVTAVGALQDAAMTGYLLETKRVRFNRRAIDFDL